MNTIKHYICFFLLILLTCTASAQSSELQEEWKAFEMKNRLTAKRGSFSLAGWGMANIISGSIGTPLSNGVQKNVHLMNLSWGAVNFAIAVPSLIRYVKKKDPETDPVKIQKNFRNYKIIYLLNAGLDIGYTLTGLYLVERSRRMGDQWDHRIKGFGYSFMIQGAYLLIYDAVMFGIYSKRNKKQDELMRKSMVKF